MTLEYTHLDLPALVQKMNVQPVMWLRSKQDKVNN